MPASTRTSISSPAGLPALLLALLAGCGEPQSPVLGPLRLVDEAARIEGAAPAGVVGATTRFAGALLGDPFERGLTDEGDWVGPFLHRSEHAEPGRVEARVVDVEPGLTLRLRASVPAGAEPGRLFGLELEVAPRPEELADPAWARRMFRELGSFQHRLEPLAADAERALFECVFTPHASTGALVVGRALSVEASESSIELEVLQFGERGGWLQSTAVPGRPAHVRSLTAAGETREAVVLGAPASAHFQLTLPTGETRLRAGLCALFADEGREPVLRVRARARGGREVEGPEVRGARDGWAPLELDLEDLAGEAVELTLEVRTPDGRPSRALLAIGAPIVTGTAHDERPDVVVISLDTVRADRSSAYGYGKPTTPTLERLARESVVFDNAITTAAWTLPAHVSVFSGQYPDRHRTFGQYSRVAADTPWLAEELRRAGYLTAAYTGGGYVNPEFGFARGFDRYGFEDPAFPPSEGVPRSRRDLLEQLGEERRAPLFLFVHTYAAHNYEATAEDLLALGAPREELDLLLAGIGPNELNGTLHRLQDEAEAARLRARAELLYDASLRVADRLVADVVDALDASGRLENTVLVVLSDHGEELFERGRFGHGSSTHEELVRVPLLIRTPDHAARRVDGVVSLVDLAPTLRELTGIGDRAQREQLEDGQSLLPLMAGATPGARAVVARGHVRDRVFRCLRSNQLKYIRETRQDTPPRELLFRLDQDLGEQRDLHAEAPDMAAALEEQLVERVQRLESLGPTRVDAEVSGDLLQRLHELGYLGD